MGTRTSTNHNNMDLGSSRRRNNNRSRSIPIHKHKPNHIPIPNNSHHSSSNSRWRIKMKHKTILILTLILILGSINVFGYWTDTSMIRNGTLYFVPLNISSTQINDSSGNGKIGNMSSNIFINNGTFNFLNFTGGASSGQSVITPNNALSGNITILMNFRLHSFKRYNFLLTQDADDTNVNYRIYNDGFSGASSLTFEGNIGGSKRSVSLASGLQLNTWYCGAFIINSTNIFFYLNKTINQSASFSGGATALGSNLNIGYDSHGTDRFLDGDINNFAIFNRGLNSSEVSTYCDGGLNYRFDSTTTTNFTITNTNNYNSQSITNFSAIINGTIYNTTTGIITTPFLTNSTTLKNITIISQNMFNKTYLNQNISTTLQATQDQYPITYLTNKWNNSNLTTATIEIDGTNYTTTSTYIYTPFNQTKSIITYVTNYLSITENKNILQNTINQINVSQSIINFSLREFDNNISLSNFTLNITGYGIPTGCNTTQSSCILYPNNGTYNYSIYDNTGQDLWTPTNNTFIINFLDNKTITSYVTAHIINITARNAKTNTSINSFSIRLDDLTDNTDQRNFTTTTGNIIIPVIHHNYNLTIISADGYALTNNGQQIYTNISITQNQNYTFNLQPTNTIDITIYDESTGQKILQNITITKIGTDLVQTTNITATGNLSIQGIDPDTYTIRFQASGYTTRQYIVTVNNQSYQTLDAYLLQSNYTTLFTCTDKNTGETLEGCTITVSRSINNTPEVVAVLLSDITGKAQLIYQSDYPYNFIVTKGNYTTKTFTLSPILLAEYEIKLQKSITQTDDQEQTGLTIYYTPKYFYNNQNNTIIYTITSPTGNLETYNVTTKYDTTTITQSGTNANGEVIPITLEIIGATIFDTVYITYCYKTTTGNTHCYTDPYSILNTTSGHTIMDNKDNTFGLGIFERVLIVTLLIIIVGGAAAYFAGPIPSALIGAALLYYFYYTGFLTAYEIAFSLIILIIVLWWRGSQ